MNQCQREISSSSPLLSPDRFFGSLPSVRAASLQRPLQLAGNPPEKLSPRHSIINPSHEDSDYQTIVITGGKTGKII